jgi:hypothetical protein
MARRHRLRLPVWYPIIIAAWMKGNKNSDDKFF